MSPIVFCKQCSAPRRLGDKACPYCGILFEDRLLIPVIAGNVLVGWQLRRLVDLPKDPYKYLNSDMKKSAVLYNMDNAKFCRDIVICEGVTDVWRVGRNAVALFGKHCSPAQLEVTGAVEPSEVMTTS